MPRFQQLLGLSPLLTALSLAVLPAEVPPGGKYAGGFLGAPGETPLHPAGDWLTMTFCFCQAPQESPDIYGFDVAHYFQHEYYNYHENATFVLDHVCMTRSGRLTESDACAFPNTGGHENDHWEATDHYTCKEWPRTEEEKAAVANSKRGREDDRGARRNTKRVFGEVEPFPPGRTPYDHPKNPHGTHPDKDRLCFRLGHSLYGSVAWRDEIIFNGQSRMGKKPVGKKWGDQGKVETPKEEVAPMCADLCQKHTGLPSRMQLGNRKGRSRQNVYKKMDDMCDHCR